MRKDVLNKKLLKRREKLNNLNARAQASTDANEVRAITEQMQEIRDEITEIEEEIAAIEADERAAQEQAEQRALPPANAQTVNGNIGVDGTVRASVTIGEQRDADPFASMEYRKAFMAYAQNGTPIPAKFNKRDGAPANTTDLGATIPTTVLNEFINEVRKVYGQLFNKVRKLNIKGNLRVPIADMQATARWITESTVSPRQDGGDIKDYVEFGYNMLETRVAQTLLSSIVSLDIFEREVVNIMLKAFLQAMDKGIVSGTGNGQMLGIINDARVTNNVTMTAAQLNNWTAWRKNFFAQLPLGYRGGEFIFPIATVDAYLETMADSNNNPIFRQATGLEVNDGDSRNPNGRFFGRNITLVEPDVLPDFDSASSNDVIGIYWQPEEYAINTNMEFGMRRYFDEERNEWVNKMLVVVDGKILNPKGFWLIKKA